MLPVETVQDVLSNICKCFTKLKMPSSQEVQARENQNCLDGKINSTGNSRVQLWLPVLKIYLKEKGNSGVSGHSNFVPFGHTQHEFEAFPYFMCLIHHLHSKGLQDISLKLTPFSFIFKELFSDTKYIVVSPTRRWHFDPKLCILRAQLVKKHAPISQRRAVAKHLSINYLHWCHRGKQHLNL